MIKRFVSYRIRFFSNDIIRIHQRSYNILSVLFHNMLFFCHTNSNKDLILVLSERALSEFLLEYSKLALGEMIVDTFRWWYRRSEDILATKYRPSQCHCHEIKHDARAPGLFLPPHTLIVFCCYYVAFYLVKCILWFANYSVEEIINNLCLSE